MAETLSEHHLNDTLGSPEEYALHLYQDFGPKKITRISFDSWDFVPDVGLKKTKGERWEEYYKPEKFCGVWRWVYVGKGLAQDNPTPEIKF